MVDLSEALPFDRAYFNSSIAMCDTSFLANLLAYNGNSTVQQECQDAIYSMVVGKSIAAISVKAAEELTGLYIRSAQAEALAKKDFTQEDLKAMRDYDPALYKKMIENGTSTAAEALSALFKTKPFLDEITGTVTNSTIVLAQELNKKYSFPSFNDSLHLAIAVENKVDFFLTTDKDFCNVNEPNLQVLVDNTTYGKYIKRLGRA